MLVEEILSEKLVKHYSDIRMQIRQEEIGILYEDAVDIRPCRYTYTETNIPIPSEPEE